MNNDALSSAAGCLFGALIGDAAGATLEFIGHKPDESEVSRAMSMVGQGVWRLASGQITDDGELTLALAQALSPRAPYDADRVAAQYRRWMLSSPFDIGIATSAAMSEGDPDTSGVGAIFRSRAASYNLQSKANGSLMRAAPIGIWGATMSLEDTINAALMDAQLSHPNPSCQWAGAAYVVAIRHLILNQGDNQGAVFAAESVLRSVESTEVRTWLGDARTGSLPPFHPQAGFVRIGFTYAFYHLLAGNNYVDALRETLLGGGDTDTNACIVGGLIGAYCGIDNIPDAMQSALVKCNTQEGRPRPDWLSTQNIRDVVNAVTQT